MPTLYLDADACPVKDEALRVTGRHPSVDVVLVSNRGFRVPEGANARSVLVGMGADAADDWIAEHAGAGDVVVTADIRLAARCLDNGARVLNPNGSSFSKANIGTALAMRELNQQLRESGVISGYNRPFSKQDRMQFLQALENLLRKAT